MSETIRIRTTPNGEDKYLKVKLDQEFDFIEVLSMKITQEEAYRNFCSDYGVIVGRVIINSGFGLPNARVSVFIPLDDEDKNDTVISGLYPYTIVTDKDSEGIRYNLLPKNSETNNDCFTPIGTFPNKREILDNEELLHVYCKYYKFTTTTNNSGDFMIFGVPLGTYNIHIDADISDIGIVSQRPYDLISQGVSPKNFYSPTKFKGGTNLDKLYQIKSANYAVNVQPFWGEQDNCEIGITRADIDMNYTIIPSALFTGSIFGDQDKNSINKRCRPRKDLGELCSQIASEGTIEMIRETIDGGIEQFDVDGGQLIDADGTWAYQVPMNLDYVVTDENGNLVPSDDPNKGIPTRASVRFKIGMEETGGEGRLRTRAKYLVPNNPSNTNEIDYKFDETTKKSSFRSLYWNKIYTVSNFIPRFQTNLLPPWKRAATGIKNVDNCPGDKNPFPFNKVNTEVSPIFFIICLVIKMVGFLIYIMNSIIIPIINFLVSILNKLIGFWNRIVDAFCNVSDTEILGVKIFKFLSFTCDLHVNEANYVKCIYTECPNDSGSYYAPGCKKTSHGFDALVKDNNPPTYYPNDPAGHPDSFGDLAGLDNCMAFEMAKSMNLFQFDFYNDWVNGTLFGFLLKYKKKRRGKERFCEYDCSPEFFSQGGVDGNKNSVGDNNCHTNYLVDLCYPEGNNSQKSNHFISLREGLIKKIDTYLDGEKINEEFIYAATKHDVSFKLFATEIICLGSVFDCDWQGIPKIQSLLIPTSYKVPPDTQEVDDNGYTETTGQVGIDGNTKGLFFEVDCLGVHSDSRQVLNIRHICEMGVDIDELDYDINNNPIPPDGIIGSNDIDEDNGKWFRDVVYDLNKNLPYSVTSFNHGATFSTNFNTKNIPVYSFASNTTQNGSDYLKFRGFQNGSDTSYGQSKNSYFFYFGIIPGRSGLDKLNQRFFTKCMPVGEKEFNIIASTTPSSNTNINGSITFTVVSGTAPFTYTISGPNGFINTGTLQIDPATGQPVPKTINGPQGEYTIEIIDVNGNDVTQTVNVDGPPPFYGSATVTKMCDSATAADGEITINSIGGGSGVWTYKLYNSNGSIIRNTTNITSIPTIISNLPSDNGSNGATPPMHGYKLVLNDGLSDVIIEDLIIDGPTPVVITLNSSKLTTCWESNDGEYNLNVTGGKAPYTINITGPASYSSNNLIATNLLRGNYVATVVDAYGTSASLNFTINSKNQQMVIVKAATNYLSKQCDPNNYVIPFLVQTGAPIPTGSVPPLKINVRYRVNDETDSLWVPIYNNVLSTTNYINGSTYVYVTIPKTLQPNKDLALSFSSVDGLCFSNEIKMNESAIRLPNTLLSINVNGINNAKQCNPNVVTFKFNISHLQIDPTYTERAPYTFKYTVNNGPQQTVTITSNQQVINASMPSISSSAVIKYTITDNKGCSASGTLPTITMPTTALSAQVTKSNTTAGIVTTCYYKFVASGGIGVKTANSPIVLNTNYVGGTGNNITPSYRPTFCSVKPSPAVTTTITDSVGCTIIKTT